MASNVRSRGRALNNDLGLKDANRKDNSLIDKSGGTIGVKDSKSKGKVTNQSPTSICRECEKKVHDGISCSCCKRGRHWECISTLDEEDRLYLSKSEHV